MRAFTYFTAAIAVVSMAACAVHQTETPGLSGPSQLALSMSVSSSPQTITQNGFDAAVVTARVFFTDPNTGATTPKANLPIRFDMQVNGAAQDFGTLSARTAVTDASGVARTTYTAPPMPAGGNTGNGCNGVPGQCVAIVATTTDSTAASSSGAIASGATTIALVPPGVILPPAGTPTASFVITPQPVSQSTPVTFDASASTPGTNATSITSYAWSFGDGTSGSGKTVSHTFNTAASFQVTLTVTNDRALSASTTQIVQVGSVAGPTAKIIISPANVITGQPVIFNGDTSTAAPGHQITTFNWTFGDGATASGSVVSHTYTTAATYNVLLSVLDDLGQKNTTSLGVTATAPGGSGGSTTPVAAFTYSPSSPVATGTTVTFDASGSTSSLPIATYEWKFTCASSGCVSTDPITTGTTATQTHQYLLAGTFVVQLTIFDSSGKPSVAVTHQITVQ